MSVREPTHIDPPTGGYDVFTYDHKSGTATLHLACGDDHGRATLAMRKAPGTACIARGGVVTSLASGTPAHLVAGLKAAVKAAPKKASAKPAAVVVNHPVSSESSVAVVEAPVSDFAAKVRAELDAVAAVLIEKNKAYGNSALMPVRVFSRATPIEQLLVRIDDKLSRLARGAAAGEDVELDLVGYLVLLRIARRA
jgi:hypothetical protein